MNILIALIVVILALSVAIFMWGTNSAKRKTAEKGEADAVKQSQEKSNIYSKPFVSKPFGKLRRKSKAKKV